MNRLFHYYRIKFTSQLGQATTEIAVMGIIILIVFGVLLRYAQMMNAQQELKMYTHRRALELAKRRRDSGRYGSVSLTAMKEVFPVNIFSSTREPTYVSASSSISMHEDTGYFFDGDVDRTQPEFVGATYYQIGADMINNDTVIVMPSMLVNRQVNDDKAPKNAWDADVRWMRDVISFGQNDSPPDNYNSLEPAPIEDVDQLVRTASSNQYSSTETLADNTYTENDSLNITQTSTYKFMNPSKVRQWDPDINYITRMPNDIVIRAQRSIQQDRTWNTPK